MTARILFIFLLFQFYFSFMSFFCCFALFCFSCIYRYSFLVYLFFLLLSSFNLVLQFGISTYLTVRFLIYFLIKQSKDKKTHLNSVKWMKPTAGIKNTKRKKLKTRGVALKNVFNIQNAYGA